MNYPRARPVKADVQRERISPTREAGGVGGGYSFFYLQSFMRNARAGVLSARSRERQRAGGAGSRGPSGCEAGSEVRANRPGWARRRGAGRPGATCRAKRAPYRFKRQRRRRDRAGLFARGACDAQGAKRRRAAHMKRRAPRITFGVSMVFYGSSLVSTGSFGLRPRDGAR